MNDLKTDFLYALLSLDSYNRHNDFRLRNFTDQNGEELSEDIGIIKFVQVTVTATVLFYVTTFDDFGHGMVLLFLPFD